MEQIGKNSDPENFFDHKLLSIECEDKMEGNYNHILNKPNTPEVLRRLLPVEELNDDCVDMLNAYIFRNSD